MFTQGLSCSPGQRIQDIGTVSSTAIKAVIDDVAPNPLAKHLPVGLFVKRAKNQFVF